MEPRSLCPAADELVLDRLVPGAHVLQIVARARRDQVPCPLCGQLARRVHSRYTRRLADLPWQGLWVELIAHVRRFFCDTPGCRRRIFVERCSGTAAVYAHRTNRAAAALERLGFTVGGRPGAALARGLGLTGGAATILRRVHAAPVVTAPTPRVLGVDDWAGRRGRSYGTLLVDLERHRVVDLLPDREMATLAAWLLAHPGVELMARDRAGAYAEAARVAAPGAIQVADRFHLLRNLSEAIERVITRHHQLVRTVAVECGTPPPLPCAAVRKRTYSGLPGNQPGPTGPERRSPERRARRLARYEQVVALRAQGAPKARIARLLHLNRRTVATWLASGAFPERHARALPAPTALDRFATYVIQRYDAGLDNAQALERALRPLGYGGSYAAVRRYLSRLRRTRHRGVSGDAPAPPDLRRPAFTAREAVWALPTPDTDLSESAQVFVAALTDRSPALATTRTLALQYRAMFHDHAATALRPWLAAAHHSELRRLAFGLERDFDAVLAGIVFPWSTGQVEGQVHRLKLVKRSMYGRASFALLRARVLHAA